jgi:hypothetical protein
MTAPLFPPRPRLRLVEKPPLAPRLEVRGSTFSTAARHSAAAAPFVSRITTLMN